MNGSLTPRDEVEAWIRLHQNRIGTLTKLKRAEEPSFNLNAWFETPGYLIDLSVWDNAYCLDITVLNVETNSTDYFVTGPCEGSLAAARRLETFLRWLQSKSPLQ
jgi:hypothetical protein